MADRNRMLSKVEEGMKVYDNEGSEVGTVEFVHFAESSGMSGAGPAATPSQPEESGLMDILAKVFGSDELPEELRERLLMHGFIKMDSAKLFGADRYIMFDQISSIEEDGVHLKVADSESLLKS
jgi:uncharacterized protein YrrD